MINLIFLFICLLCLLFLEFCLLEQDILAPSFIITAVFLLSVITVIIEYNSLIYELSFKTAFIVISGITVFFIVELIISFLLRGRNRKIVNKYKMKKKELIIGKNKLYLLCLFNLFIMVATYLEVKRIASIGGYNTGSLINDYKLISSYSNSLSIEERMNPILSQLTKVTMVSAYICALVITNNVIACGKKLKEEILYIVPILLWLPVSILKGGRLDLIQFVVAEVVFIYVIGQIHSGWNINHSIKSFWKILKFMPLFFICFYILKLIMGTGSEINLWDYIFVYIGAPLINLEAYIGNPLSKSPIWGKETFYRIYNAMWQLGITEYHFTSHLEFRTLGENYKSNLYTVFRRLIQDFDIFGMYILVAFFSFIYNLFYYIKIKVIKSTDNYTILLYYAILFYPIVLFAVECYVTSIITFGLIITLILVPILYFGLTKIKLHFR